VRSQTTFENKIRLKRYSSGERIYCFSNLRNSCESSMQRLERGNAGEKQVFNSKRDNLTKSVLSKYVLIASAMLCCIVILLQSSVTMFLFASMEFLANSEKSLVRNPLLSTEHKNNERIPPLATYYFFFLPV
jgi:hypothetical protein